MRMEGRDSDISMPNDAVFIEIFGMLVETVRRAGRYLEAFEEYDTRMEGWFHGELVNTIGASPHPGWRLLEVGKKIGANGGRPDLFIEAGGEKLTIELKSMVVGRRALKMYFAKSFGKDLRKLAASSGPMCLLTVAFPISDETKWRELTDSVLSEYNTSPLVEEKAKYGRDRTARVTLWKKRS